MVVKKTGYYRSERRLHGINDRVELLMRPIHNPIPMYAGCVFRGPQSDGETRSFDFDENDWLPPFGKGKRADIHFHCRASSSAIGWDKRNRIYFPNPGDGIQLFDYGRFAESLFQSPRMAPLDGYAPEYEEIEYFTAGKGGGGNRRGGKGGYFLRIRTVKDQQGRIVSAHYVKVYGEFFQVSFYLNPGPLDRNMEFDPNSNLFGNAYRGHERDDHYRVSRP